jgi:hypothetical protein
MTKKETSTTPTHYSTHTCILLQVHAGACRLTTHTYIHRGHHINYSDQSTLTPPAGTLVQLHTH